MIKSIFPQEKDFDIIMNMKTCGIITEYNPFHQGHIYHIKKTKELTQCNCLIAIVSNHFTQRGLPSLLSMEDKTKLALEAGCNLVIELPACYAAQSADYFAKYAIESLHALNIDQICFGSETNDIGTLREYAKQMESTKVDPSLSMNRNLYSKDIQPNDILGIQYIKQCDKYNILPQSISRKNQPWQRMHHKMLPLSGKMQSERSSLLHYAGINPCGKRRCKRWSYFLRRQCRLP